MRTLARNRYLPRRCATDAPNSRGNTARISSGAARASASSAITRPLRVVQPGERARSRGELLGVGRELALQEARGVGAAKREHAETSRRPTDRRQLACSSLFLLGFHVV
jgi:hypothetical protein